MDLKRPGFIAALLLLSIVFYSRLTGNENIRPLQFLYIWVIGFLSGILITFLSKRIRSKFKSKD